jgi:hypothetical protein
MNVVDASAVQTIVAYCVRQDNADCDSRLVMSS